MPRDCRVKLFVSIHAPARGATPRATNRGRHNAVSIHAPARGATAADEDRPECHMSFNPRAREGRDLVKEFRDSVTIRVSIHAPARGAT